MLACLSLAGRLAGPRKPEAWEAGGFQLGRGVRGESGSHQTLGLAMLAEFKSEARSAP